MPSQAMQDRIDAFREQQKASLAIHLMANTAITGATFDIDGGQQLIAA